MTAPAAILASSVSIRSLADGTLRLSVDIEPNDAQAAFALFGKPGSPVAIARVTNSAAVEHDRRQQATAPDPLPPHKMPAPLSSRVAMTCAEKSFAPFLRSFDPDGFGAVEASGCKEPVAQYVREYCGVTSRSDIRPGTPAAALWDTICVEYEYSQRAGRAA